jgi:hypothetical protein
VEARSRHFDIKSFGVNAYTAEEAGQRVVEEHREDGGHEELYVVISGRATFMVDGEEHDAPTGTLVHCTPGTLRGAIAAEPGTTVLGIGAKQGEIFQPSGWEWVFAGSPCSSRATRRARGGSSRLESRPIRARGRGRSTSPCIEARLGNREAAFEQLERAAQLDREAVAKYAPSDEDFASIREDPRFLAITGQSDAVGASS